MKQYCRYCSHANCVEEDVMWCEITKSTSTKKQACRVNKCKDFEFNPMDVFNLNKIYKPKEKKEKEFIKTKLWEENK